MIEYKISDRIIPNELDCFFQDWKSPPSPEIKGKLLNGADLIITARENGRLIGFLTAISDGVMHAFITLIEVLEGNQGKRYMKFRTPNLKNEKFIKDIIKINQ